jgi:hypothetical protein
MSIGNDMSRPATTIETASFQRFARGAAAFVGFVAMALSAGCEEPRASRGAPDAGPPEPIPFERFCIDYMDAVCARAERCACGADILTTCRAAVPEWCTSLAVRTSLDSGAIVYDGAAAARLVADIRQMTSCRTIRGELGWTGAEVASLGRVLSGTKGTGEACTPLANVSECFSGGCSEDAELGTFACAEVSTIGTSCDLGCFRGDVAYGDPPLPAILLRTQLACDRTTNRCRPRSPNGSPCFGGDDCESLNCDGASFDTPGVCNPPQPDGSLCESSFDCVSLYCDGFDASAVCRSPKPDGAACAEESACASGLCRRDRCMKAACQDVPYEDFE